LAPLARFAQLPALILALAVPAVAVAGSARLADGGFAPQVRQGQVGAGAIASPEPPRALAARLGAATGAALVTSGSVARPKAFGDHVVVSLDSGLGPAPLLDYEASLDVAAGPAGPAEAVAARFPSRLLAVRPPFRVSDVLVGLDDKHGATTWPVELWLEDPINPLVPRSGPVSDSGSLDAVAGGLVPRTSAWRPTVFARLPTGLSLDVPDAWLSDGSFDDAFARVEGPLDDGLSDWLECQGSLCGGDRVAPPEVDVVAGRADRTSAGQPVLLVKFQQPDVYAIRPALDLDVVAAVGVRDSAAGFRRAGLALRVMAVDAYYRVEYVEGPNRVEVTAVTPGGDVPLATLPVATPTSGTRRLSVAVSWVAPAVEMAVSVDGAPVGIARDAVYRFTGPLVGLVASDPAGVGEAWDDLVVQRRHDVFVVITQPPGEDVALPLEVGDDALITDSILVSTDGVAFTPLALAPGCVNPGNPYVQVEVEETDPAGGHLFDREARIVSVELDCPTCPKGPQDCSANTSIAAATEVQPVEDEPHDVVVSWWNERLLDEDLIFEAQLWSGPCDASGAAIGSVSGRVVGDPGQAGGPPRVGTFRIGPLTPPDPGAYCVVVKEMHDANRDCCPDGEETTPLAGCPGPCVSVAASDSNPSTAFVLREIFVSGTCTPRTPDVGRDGPDDVDGDGSLDEINLDGGSLRVAFGPGGTDEVVLSWSRLDTLVPPARYNVRHVVGAAFDRTLCPLDFMPVIDRPSNVTTRTYSVPATGAGTIVHWFSVHETDDCTADADVSDSASDDPARPPACG
jgi:hypothetical protein